MRRTEIGNKLKIPQINLPSQKARVGRVRSSPVAGEERRAAAAAAFCFPLISSRYRTKARSGEHGRPIYCAHVKGTLLKQTLIEILAVINSSIPPWMGSARVSIGEHLG